VACFGATQRTEVGGLRNKKSGGRILARHPWEITLREFVKTARRNYGIEIDLRTAAVAGSALSKQVGTEGWVYPLLTMDPDEIMPISVLRYLCWFYGLPPEDFGLDPEEER
jgi:hypothetical protein